ncbi:ABC transporter G family member 11-like [Iris pallida]|uniref:ABC transporter G family member 11-like n=1 Tax=Iris pallida TaxID=29817 RepID=A0AAX6DJF7_IRIPA|nr:ABC transporter G family member 11-like [Iris pallida]
MTTLTVREAVYYSAELQLPPSLSGPNKRSRAEDTIREMGLLAAGDTRIGRVSGGQRRRVSVCVEMLTRPRLLFLDEPTSGLDSAASYHVLGRIARLARREAMTVVASVHQPSGEMLEMFHSLCLLAYGKTVYFGPTSLANEFFALNGFPCPSLTNPSDHYLRTINKDFDQDVEEGLQAMPTSVAKAIETLVDSYKSSILSQQVLHRIAEIHEEGGGLVKKGSRASFTVQCLVLTRRSFVNMYRDAGYYWLRLVIYIALGICLGTMFHDLGHSHSYGSIQDRGSMLMFVSGFLTFMAIGGFPSFVEDMKIFARERLNGHYGVTPFVIGNTLSSAPYLALVSVVPGAIAYYLAGLRGSFPHFAYFILVLFTSLLLVESLMMIVASVVLPNFLMGIIAGAGIQGVMLLNGGFFRLPNDIPKPVWRYPCYSVSLHKYANQGLYKNEFMGQTFSGDRRCVDGGPADCTTVSGEEILRDVWQMEMGHSKWIDLVVLCGMVVVYRLLFLVIVKTVEKLKPVLRK